VPGAANYYLWVNGAGTWYSASAAGCSSGTGTCSITGSALANGSYSWVVIANNATGNGPTSSSLNFTVSAAASGFNEQFTSSTSAWSQSSGAWTWQSGDYWYTPGLAGLVSTSLYTAGSFANFDLSVRMLRSGSSQTKSNSVWIRASAELGSDGNPLNGYRFNYTSLGRFSVWKYVNGVESALQDWTSSSLIAQGSAFNTLRVYASGASLYYYINGSMVWSASDSSLSTGLVGVGMSRFGDYTSTNEGFYIDYATLSTLAGGVQAPLERPTDEQNLNNLNPTKGGTGDGM
jgi:hypothetical protein